ncbi:MAG: hypothetical protein U9N40_04865 [Euryarchaeota archaeon]|nr:hypothetical protein [Euryarchaeota archaeon]
MDIDLKEPENLFDKYPFLLQTSLKIKDNTESRERYGRPKKSEIYNIASYPKLSPGNYRRVNGMSMIK